jgi:nucleotide-binding universal stress UspA family protein
MVGDRHEEVGEMSAPAEVHPIIVVGYDGSPASGVALDRAVERVGSTGRLYVVIAWRPPTRSVTGQGLYQSKMGQARADVEAVVEAARKAHPALNNVAWEPKLIARPAPQAIADVATTRAADEIILGTRGFGRVRALLGSVAHEVIHLASCPVTVIPQGMLKGEAAGGGVEAADASLVAPSGAPD